MSLGNPALHQTLLNTMAQAQGFDLASARASGAVSDADLADMMTRCRGCSDPEACAKALEKGERHEGCENDSRWDALRKVTGM